MPYLKDPDHYTRGAGAIASIDHNRGRRNMRVMVERKTQLMDRQKLAQRALGAVPARGAGPPRQPPTFRGPSKMIPQRGGPKYVGTPVMPVSPVPPQFVVDPAPPSSLPPQQGLVFTGGGSSGGGGAGGASPSPLVPSDPTPQDPNPGDDVDQILTPPDPASVPSSDSSSTMLIAVGVAAGLGALFLYFRKED